ncbi:MAG: GatB/YqeY domain-containing protein [Caldilineaceae bacterium]|nr:GatB/YqeY domain-containing protein [Caldilineaceae bacterium]MCB9148423.1 GatB/YqeY domain-containing protein [Caldilineaceae bacterium]
MTLELQIDADLKRAMLDKDNTAKLALRSVKTALTEARKSGAAHQLDDEETLAVVQKEAKRRRDAAAEYKRLGQAERADEELAELVILERYLPQQLSEAQIEEIVRQVIAEVGAESPRDMGKVMSATMPKVAGVADGKAVNKVAQRLLSGSA